MSTQQNRAKVVIIGAASRFGAGMIEYFLKSDEVRNISLLDLDYEKSSLIAEYGRARARALHRDVKIQAFETKNQKRALEGSHFVFTTLNVGDPDHLYSDFEIMNKHGYFLYNPDTVGPGGLFRIFRFMPVFKSILSDMEKVCPNAVLINESNPLSAVTRMVYRLSHIKCVSLCTPIEHAKSIVANLLHEKIENIYVEVGGINHFSFILRAQVNEKDIYEDIKKAVQDLAYQERNQKIGDLFDYATMRETGTAKLKQAFLELFGVIPMMDGHAKDFVPGMRATKRPREEPWARQVARSKKDLWERLKKEIEKDKAEIPDSPEIEKGMFPLKIMQYIWHDSKRQELVNIPNKNFIAQLPKDSIVEVPVILGRQVTPQGKPLEIPLPLRGIMQAHVQNQELAVEAALTGNLDLALSALLTDPVSPLIIEETRDLFKEMVEKNKKYLPQFQF